MLEAKAFESAMIEERRYFHRHPELSGQEEATIAYIRKVQEELGMNVYEVPRGGIIGVLNEDRTVPAILLRSELDALPVTESETNLAGSRTCLSEKPGVMHACGHDAHMAMLLCAARALAKDPPKTPVLFVFERGEEDNSGIGTLLRFIEASFPIAFCYACHVRWDTPSGTLVLKKGGAMAGGLGFEVEIQGHGGHGARPDLASSPIDCFAAIHQRLQQLRMTGTRPDAVLTYSLGTVHSGETKNVIPESLIFSGTVRTFDTEEAGEHFANAMRETIREMSRLYGCTANILHFPRPLYETRNHESVRLFAEQALSRVPEISLGDTEPWMASETFGAYLRLWPGALAFLGIRSEGKGSGAGHHTPEFDVDEDALLTGAAAMTAIVRAYDADRPTFSFERSGETLDELLERRL